MRVAVCKNKSKPGFEFVRIRTRLVTGFKFVEGLRLVHCSIKIGGKSGSRTHHRKTKAQALAESKTSH